MAVECKREAFKFDDGCPDLNVDTTFPDFNACEELDPGKLKSTAKLDLQKTPAFPVVIPSGTQMPFPDIDVGNCPFDGMSSGDSSIEVSTSSDIDEPVSSITVKADPYSCKFIGIDISIILPQVSSASAEVVPTTYGGVSLMMNGVSLG